MEDKFFLPIFHTLPKSHKWTRVEFFKQLQFEYHDLRDCTISDFTKVWLLLMKANIVSERRGVLGLTKKGRFIARLNYASFTMKHLEFHEEHGEEYMVRFEGDNAAEARNFFINMLYNNFHEIMLGILFIAAFAVMVNFMVGKTTGVFEPGFKKLENELDKNINQGLDQAIPKDLKP